MNQTVKASNYVTCICGRVCKGKSAHQTHARACTQEQARSDAFIDAIERDDWSSYRAQYNGTQWSR